MIFNRKKLSIELADDVSDALAQIALKNSRRKEAMAAELITDAIWARDESLAASATAGGYAGAPPLYRIAEGLLHAALDAHGEELLVLAGTSGLRVLVRNGAEERELLPTAGGVAWPPVPALMERLEKRSGLFHKRWDAGEPETQFALEHPPGRVWTVNARYATELAAGLRFIFKRS